jgi:hypothetical protein
MTEALSGWRFGEEVPIMPNSAQNSMPNSSQSDIVVPCSLGDCNITSLMRHERERGLSEAVWKGLPG